MLRNPYYVGTVRYGGVEYKGRHEPLIDRATFSRAQAVLDAHGAAHERDRKHHHYLKGSPICANCGSRLTYVRAKGNGGTYAYFACIGRIKRTGCRLPYLSADEIENRVLTRYGRVKLEQGGARSNEEWSAHLDDVRDAVDEVISKMQAHNAREVRNQRQRIGRIKEQQRRLLDAFLDNALSKSLLQEKQDALEQELGQAERLLTLAEQDGVLLQRVLHEAIDLAQHCQEAYELASPTTRRQLNQTLFNQIKVGVGERRTRRRCGKSSARSPLATRRGASAQRQPPSLLRVLVQTRPS